MLTAIKNLVGCSAIGLSIYLCLSVTSAPIFGVFHLPSLYLVVGVTFGIAVLIIDTADIKRFFLFWVTYSSSRYMRQMETTERSFEKLVHVYTKEGGEGFRKIVSEDKMPTIWNIVATKLAINVPIADIKDILDFQIHRVVARLDQDITTLKQVASLAPAIGMFGSILGLIRLLADLQDFDSLGPNMSLALITTLYGIFIGNILLVPLIRSVEKRKVYSIKNHTNLLYWLDHVSKKKPAFYLKTRLRDLDVKSV